MKPYRITSGTITVTARSSIHDTRAIWPRVSGELAVDPHDPAAGASAEIRVDMREFDAGDRLKNWKLKSDLKPEEHPTATFVLDALEDVARAAEGVTHAKARGRLSWRGRTTVLTASGEGTLGPDTLFARARFELDVGDLGVSPPRVLMFKVESVVSVEVSLTAEAA